MKSAALLVALSAAGCYSPNPQDKGFMCDAMDNFLCPEGLFCDKVQGLCVKTLPPDGGTADLAFTGDLATAPLVRSCDQKVTAGAFANLVNLGAVNSAGDEHSLTVSADGSRIYFLDGANALKTATLTSRTSASAPSPVTITGGPTTLNGGSLGSDGNYYFSGTMAGVTSLWTASIASPTSLTALAPRKPVAAPPQYTCPFTDPVFTNGDPTNELFLSFPLGDCTKGAMIAQGTAGKQLNAFFGVVAVRGLRAPTVVAGGLTMLMSSAGANAQLFYAQRPSTDVQFTGPTQLPLGALGPASGPEGDVQAVVGPMCQTLYLVADRAGGQGGTDLWAADIAAQ